MSKVFIFTLALLAVGVSCSQNVDSISIVSPTVIFDYDVSQDTPAVSLTVFAQPTYLSERVSDVKLVHVKSGYIWQSAEPVILSERRANGWAGCINCIAPDGEDLPEGKYVFSCTDQAGDTVETAFDLSYPKEIMRLSQDEASDFIKTQKGAKAYTALYDGEGTLIYYGSEDAGRETYPTARTKRLCYVFNDGKSVCMLSKENL